MITKNGKILLLPGDGIGPEVNKALKEVINCINNFTNISLEVDEELVGGSSYDVHGTPLTDRVLK